jgi:3-oxoadipate enol-lactonase
MAMIEANGVQFRYEIDGPSDGPVLMLSNSLGTDVSMWTPQMPAFSKRFRVVRYDTRGHGASAVTPGPYTIEQLARDAVALLDRLGIDRVHFCGLSMGGMIGMWLGVNAPERINKLVLCNTAARIGPPDLWNTRIENVRKGGMEAIANAVLERWFTLPFRERAASAIEPVRRTLVATPPDGYVACCAAVRDMDQREAVARVRAPTLVIAGAQDAATPPQDGRFVAERIPGAKYVELEAAHLSNIELADEFTDAVVRFLGE